MGCFAFSNWLYFGDIYFEKKEKKKKKKCPLGWKAGPPPGGRSAAAPLPAEACTACQVTRNHLCEGLQGWQSCRGVPTCISGTLVFFLFFFKMPPRLESRPPPWRSVGSSASPGRGAKRSIGGSRARMRALVSYKRLQWASAA